MLNAKVPDSYANILLPQSEEKCVFARTRGVSSDSLSSISVVHKKDARLMRTKRDHPWNLSRTSSMETMFIDGLVLFWGHTCKSNHRLTTSIDVLWPSFFRLGPLPSFFFLLGGDHQIAVRAPGPPEIVPGFCFSVSALIAESQYCVLRC